MSERRPELAAAPRTRDIRLLGPADLEAILALQRLVRAALPDPTLLADDPPEFFLRHLASPNLIGGVERQGRLVAFGVLGFAVPPEQNFGARAVDGGAAQCRELAQYGAPRHACGGAPLPVRRPAPPAPSSRSFSAPHPRPCRRSYLPARGGCAGGRICPGADRHRGSRPRHADGPARQRKLTERIDLLYHCAKPRAASPRANGVL
jgi:hypothetical protein